MNIISLSKDCLYSIGYYLNTKDISNFSSTCKYFKYKLYDNRDFWIYKIFSDKNIENSKIMKLEVSDTCFVSILRKYYDYCTSLIILVHMLYLKLFLKEMQI